MQIYLKIHADMPQMCPQWYVVTSANIHAVGMQTNLQLCADIPEYINIHLHSVMRGIRAADACEYACGTFC